VIEHLVTSGTFSLDGGTWNVDNNVWLVGDERKVLVIDPAHDVDAIVERIGDRRVVAIVCTHGHDDHIRQAPALADRVGAPIVLNPADELLWRQTHPDRQPELELRDGQLLTVGDIALRALATPGHSPGSTCLHAPELSTVFSGDTLFRGGPGATGRSATVGREQVP
jgi:glyoxylase-like metal-dependent hydrolase (beta-lactamase superfamily II)